jgi:uncharacterized protein YodC (DUF2158 family)
LIDCSDKRPALRHSSVTTPAYRARDLHAGLMEPIMKLKAGDVVVLKSGGQALTVAEVNDENIECIWIGEEGELFRETLPAITLELAAVEDDEEDEEENGDEEEEEDDEDEDDEKAVA